MAGILFLCLQLAVIPCNDDLFYSHRFDAYPGMSAAENSNMFGNCRGPEISDLTDVAISVKNHYLYFNNARFANSLAFLSNLVPHWLTDAVSALMFAVMIVMLSRFGFGRGLTPARTMATVTASALLLSWAGPMMTADFLMNYLWAAAITLVWLWLLVGREKGTTLWIMLPLSFLAGGMHEAFTLAFGAAAAVTLLQTGRLKNPRKMAPLALYLIVVGVITLSPSLLRRLSEAAATESVDLTSPVVIATIILSYAGAVAAVMATAAAVVSHRADRRAILRETLPFFAAIMVNTAISLVSSNFEGRTAWPANLAGIIIIFRAARLSDIKVTIPMKTTLVSAFILWMLTVTGLTIAQYRKSRYLKSFQETLAAAAESPAVYFDLQPDSPLPFFLEPFTTGSLYVSMYARQQPRNGTAKAVIPLRYKGLPPDSLPLIPGTAGVRGQFPWFLTDRGICPDWLLLTFGVQRDDATAVQRVPFVREIIGVLHGKRIINPDLTRVTVLTTEPIAGLEGWSTIFCLDYSPLYNGRQITRVDTIPASL